MVLFTYDDPHSEFPTEVESENLIFREFSYSEYSVRDIFEALTTESAAKARQPPYPFGPPETVHDAQEYYEKRTDGDAVVYYFLIEKETGDFVGVTKFNTKWQQQSAFIGIWLDSAFWGNGYASERAHAFFELAFTELNLTIVKTRTAVDNEKAQRAIEKYMLNYGGKKEGVLRNNYYNQQRNQPDTVIQYSITNEEWKEN